MRISRGLGMALALVGTTLLAPVAYADEASCTGADCPTLAAPPVLTTAVPVISDDSVHFVAQVPLPPVRSQGRVIAVARPKVQPVVVLASARNYPAYVTPVVLPARDISKLTSFWLTVGTGF